MVLANLFISFLSWFMLTEGEPNAERLRQEVELKK